MISLVPLIYIVVVGIVLAIMTGIANRLREGALNDYLMHHKKGYRVSHTITRVIVTILALLSFYIPLKYNTGIEVFSSWKSFGYLVFAFLSFFIFGLCSGWGSYFDLETNKREYVDHREILWIDWILYKIFGPIWIPNNVGYKTAFERNNNLSIDRDAFDIIRSPDKKGKERPKSWRFKRDMVGMALRGLQFYIPLTFVIYYQLKVCFSIYYPSLFYIIPFGLLFGAMYKIGMIFNGIGGKYVKGFTHKGEILTGIFLFSYIPYFILLFNF